jgi:hypothetical protein
VALAVAVRLITLHQQRLEELVLLIKVTAVVLVLEILVLILPQEAVAEPMQ